MATISEALSMAAQHVHAGKRAEAALVYQKILARKPDEGRALHALGMLAFQDGDYAGSSSYFQSLTELRPNVAEFHNLLGLARQSEGKLQKAFNSFRRATELDADFAEAHFNLGNLLHRAGKVSAAIASFRKALRLKPGMVEAHINLGVAQREAGNARDAASHFERALQLDPASVEAHCNVGALAQAWGDWPKATHHYSEALRVRPHWDDAVAGQAAILEKQGDIEGAFRLLQPRIDADSSNVDVALVFAAVTRQLGRPADARAPLERLVSRGEEIFANKRIALHFTLGRLCADLGEHDTAFENYSKAKNLKVTHYVPADFTSNVDALISVFTADLFAQNRHAVNDSDLPVFIVGMPRSGTSLVEQIIASHPLVFGAGELQEIGRLAMSITAEEYSYPAPVSRLPVEKLNELASSYLSHLRSLSPDAERVTDKMPGNFLHLGLIALLFPRARIIHCRRDPLDTCISSYFANFLGAHPYTNNLEHLGLYYRDYLRLMTHWRSVLPMPIHEVQYETLVEEPEQSSRKLIEFCGLEWDERCLRFYEQKRIVTTASYSQVRRPIYKDSIGRSRAYDAHLGPLKEALKS